MSRKPKARATPYARLRESVLQAIDAGGGRARITRSTAKALSRDGGFRIYIQGCQTVGKGSGAHGRDGQHWAERTDVSGGTP